MFVILAQGAARPEAVGDIQEALRAMVAYCNSDQEPGCLLYVVHQSIEDPTRFMLYEQYVDEAAFEAHKESDMFKKHVAGTVVAGLENGFRVGAYTELA